MTRPKHTQDWEGNLAWIPLSARCPQPCEAVVVLLANGTTTGAHWDGRGWIRAPFDRRGEIVAWAQLPTLQGHPSLAIKTHHKTVQKSFRNNGFCSGSWPAPIPPTPLKIKAKLLLVEDHDDTRDALARILTKHGFGVDCAKSAAEAVKLATKSPFDLVLIDHGLPDGNGCGLMKVLHQVYKLEGIALTANAYASDEVMSREAGFRAHLIKPIDAATLCSAIEGELAKAP